MPTSNLGRSQQCCLSLHFIRAIFPVPIRFFPDSITAFQHILSGLPRSCFRRQDRYSKVVDFSVYSSLPTKTYCTPAVAPALHHPQRSSLSSTSWSFKVDCRPAISSRIYALAVTRSFRTAAAQSKYQHATKLTHSAPIHRPRPQITAPQFRPRLDCQGYLHNRRCLFSSPVAPNRRRPGLNRELPPGVIAYDSAGVYRSLASSPQSVANPARLPPCHHILSTSKFLPRRHRSHIHNDCQRVAKSFQLRPRGLRHDRCAQATTAEASVTITARAREEGKMPHPFIPVGCAASRIMTNPARCAAETAAGDEFQFSRIQRGIMSRFPPAP
ncbi:hypothetical protein QBC47DRAFT_21603 [Echria macrotheca]|uniref:Uncharacterized protein n=1 Tax=Echria macrotheca TaxID=438768 RepID=A0AAJ0BNE2_9PEZI|nr:hypothetical protein QBC47DRAFT_21603 [Echria macrotheca]